ncbi:urea transporter [Paenibacillus sp. Marseille-Q4541]|uniref:urea transporter n=1 Tax=Paenibacillus sp. Marseille-Q4541 TaxID=2831522 RepID=UPI001BAB756D|nr:urea transporter [Paenibacillus sp. Marseille-Q4541]
MQRDEQNAKSKGELLPILSTTLKGISQVIFIENAVTGLIILIAITISSVSVGVIALLSSLLATLIGKFGRTQKSIVDQGLLGYNSVLAGIALSLNLEGSMRWIIALAGAVVVVFFTAGMMHWMQNLKIPVLTFPYIILTWFLLLATYQLGAFRLSPELVPQDLVHMDLHPEGTIDWVSGLINGIGQVFFQDQFLSGILVIIGVFWASWRMGFYTIIGSAVALLTAYGLGAEVTLLNLGLYGFNAVLTILAVGHVFDSKSRLAPWTGIIAAVICVPITASITTWLLPYGLPTLTMPFVLSTWLFLAARKFMPRI